MLALIIEDTTALDGKENRCSLKGRLVARPDETFVGLGCSGGSTGGNACANEKEGCGGGSFGYSFRYACSVDDGTSACDGGVFGYSFRYACSVDDGTSACDGGAFGYCTRYACSVDDGTSACDGGSFGHCTRYACSVDDGMSTLVPMQSEVDHAVTPEDDEVNELPGDLAL